MTSDLVNPRPVPRTKPSDTARSLCLLYKLQIADTVSGLRVRSLCSWQILRSFLLLELTVCIENGRFLASR